MARGAKSHLVSFNGGATVTAVKGLPLEPRERFQRDHPLAADLGAGGIFYYLQAATGRLFVSSNAGRTFSPTGTTLPAAASRYTLVAVRARPSTAGEVWVSQQWAGLWRCAGARRKLHAWGGITPRHMHCEARQSKGCMFHFVAFAQPFTLHCTFPRRCQDYGGGNPSREEHNDCERV
jgi:hypothetical protein